ncbi:sigma factor [Streptosporangium sandarakinum]
MVRAGDDRAVSELYERHHPAVIAFARRLCQDPHTAEDLASEAFARVAAPAPGASPTPGPTRVRTRAPEPTRVRTKAPTRGRTPAVRVTTPGPASRSPRPTSRPGTRIAHAGRCVGAAGGLVAALPCGAGRTSRTASVHRASPPSGRGRRFRVARSKVVASSSA